MKKIVVLAAMAFCFFAFNLNAQTAFQKVLGRFQDERIISVIQTADGGYVLGGYTSKKDTVPPYGSINQDFLLVKLDATANIVWAKTYGSPNTEETFTSCKQTKDGGFVLVGHTGTNILTRNAFLVKTDAIGDTLFTRTIGEYNGMYCLDVLETGDGGFVMSGNMKDLSSRLGIFLYKMNIKGDSLWSVFIAGSAQGINYVSTSFGQTTDGGYIIAGYYSYGQGYSDMLLLKTDSLGKVLWNQTYGQGPNDVALSVQQTDEGGYIMGGTTSVLGTSDDLLLVKTNAKGDTNWTKAYGGGANEGGGYVRQTSDKGYILSGSTASFGAGGMDAYLIKTDLNGNLSWSKTYGGVSTEYFAGPVQQTNDGYVVGGGSASFVGGGLYIVKTDVTGNSYCSHQADAATLTSHPPIAVGSNAPTSNVLSCFSKHSNTELGILGGGSNTICTTAEVLEEVKQNITLSISPNPVTSIATITMHFANGLRNAELKITDILGKEVKRISIYSTEVSFDRSGMENGIYFCKLINDGKQIAVCKVIMN
jgi:hypothetical protein